MNQRMHCIAALHAGELLTCPIMLTNVGNVALQTIALMTPASACTAPLLEPNGPPHTCSVSIIATQDDFENKAVVVYLAGVAAPQTAHRFMPSITWNGSAVVGLTSIGRLHVDAVANPMVVTAAGKAASAVLTK